MKYIMENSCRFCLNESPDIVEELWEGCDILKKLSTCLSYYISISEELPSKICYPCVNIVHNIYSFYQQISQNEIILQQRLHNQSDDNKYADSIKQDNDSDNDNELSKTFKTDEPSVVDVQVKKETLEDAKNPLNDHIITQANGENKIEKQYRNQSNDNLEIDDQVEPVYGPADDIPLSVMKDNKNNIEIPVTKSVALKKFTCLTCFESFDNQLELSKHYQNVELDKFNKNNKDLDKQTSFVKYKIITESDGSLCYKCDRCYKKYKHKKYIDRHVKSHIDRRPYLCNLCGKTYQTVSIILAHGKMHSGDMHFCSYNCGYKSVHKHVVMAHEARHRKEFKYKCQTCGKGFQVQTWYRQHQNIHNDIKPFSCDLCDKTFHLHRYLMSHKSNVHPQSSARKPWVCKQCFKPCDSKNSLNLHLKKNHGIVITKPTLCDICGKIMRDAHQLKYHKRAVHLKIKPFSCSFCNKSFQKKFTLKVHEQTHTGKRYLCSMCDRMFTRKDTLIRHLKNSHTDNKNKCPKCEKTFSSKMKLVAHQKICTYTIDNENSQSH